MRSFQTLVTLVTMMLFVSKEAAALPQPQVPPANTASNNIGAVGNQVGVASGNISPSSVNVPVYAGYPSYAGYPPYAGYPSYAGYPTYGYPTYALTPSGNTATSQIGAVGNQIGVASGNINPTSTNFPRDLEARDLESRFFFPLFFPPSAAAPSKTVTSALTTNDNAVGVIYGTANGNTFDIGSAINPTSTNSARDLEARDDLESRFFFPLFFPPAAPAPSKTVTSTLNTNNNGVGVVAGSATGNTFTIGSAINPTSSNSARDLEARDLESRFFIPLFFPPAAPAPSVSVASTLNTNGNLVGVVAGGTANNNKFTITSAINPSSTNRAREVDVPPPNVANSNIGAVGNQIGVASGNISPSSFNAGQFFPNYPIYPTYSGYPTFSAFLGNSATNSVGTVGNQIGVATGNINPGSTNM